MFFFKGSGSGTVVLVGGNLKENNHAVKSSADTAIKLIFTKIYWPLDKNSFGNLDS